MRPGVWLRTRGAWLVAAVFLAAAACSGEDGSRETLAGDAPAAPREDARFAPRRARMVAAQIEARGVVQPEVLRAMRSVPRHRFVPERYRDHAYENRALPIGFGQTISQPFIVALMTAALQLEPGATVLEIGTGSGYQAAVLAEMGMTVYTIEIIPELAERATFTLQSLGYTNVAVRAADGYVGWPEHAPFGAVLVTAAPDHVPHPLVQQLRLGGRLVIPVGPVGAVQTLWKFTRDESGPLRAQNLGAVRFVPLTRRGE